MGLFRMPMFIRRYLRRHTYPVPVEQAIERKKWLAVAYTLITWNFFGYVIYKFIKNQKENPNENAVMREPWWVGNVYSMKENTVKTFRWQGSQFVHTKSESSVEDSEEESEELY